MKLPAKIVFLTVGLAIGFALILTAFYSKVLDGFVANFALTSFVAGPLYFLIGLFLLSAKDKQYAQGFLMSGGLLLLLGFLVCTLNWGA